MKTKSINDLNNQIWRIRRALYDKYMGTITDYIAIGDDELRRRARTLKVAVSKVDDIHRRYVNNIRTNKNVASLNARLHAEMKKYSRGYDSWYAHLSQQAQSNTNNLQVPPSVYMHI